jgi:hypothetical protein
LISPETTSSCLPTVLICSSCLCSREHFRHLRTRRRERTNWTCARDSKPTWPRFTRNTPSTRRITPTETRVWSRWIRREARGWRWRPWLGGELWWRETRLNVAEKCVCVCLWRRGGCIGVSVALQSIWIVHISIMSVDQVVLWRSIMSRMSNYWKSHYVCSDTSGTTTEKDLRNWFVH